MTRSVPRLVAVQLAAVAALSFAGAASVSSPAAAAPTAEPSAPRPALAARLTGCATGTTDASRFAEFTGSMPVARGARRLWMRFDLERQRPSSSTWSRVSAPTFGEWKRSRSGVAGFVYSKRVEGLSAPAQYRARVSFRWVDARGRTLRRATRTTRACVQPDPRPDLSVLRPVLVSTPSGPAVDVTVRNTGRGDSLAPAVVDLSVGGERRPSQTLPPLGPGVRITLRFPLERECAPGTLVEALVDPADGIAEADERDNRARLRCL